MLVLVSSAIEAATGAALIAVPVLVGRLLLGVELPGSGIAVAKVAGFALLSLAIACWPHGDDAAAAAIRALLAYNLLAALYFAYLGSSGAFFSYLLWPACALHGLLALLLVLPAYNSLRSG